MPNTYLINPINIDLWNSAKWIEVAFIVDLSYEKIPVIGFVFENIEYGKGIFQEWISIIGEVDDFEQLRVSIIEGPLDGEEGYSVIIGCNPINVINAAKQNDENIYNDVFILGSRIHRTPAPRAKSLEMFKRAYEKKHTFMIIPVTINNGDHRPIFDHGIVKKEINLRHISDISLDDQDSAMFLGQ